MKHIIFLSKIALIIFIISLINCNCYCQWVQTAFNPLEPVNAMLWVGNTVYAGTTQNGIWRSTDNGDTWTSSNNGITDPYIRALVRVEGNILFAGTAGGKVFRSLNGGNSWELFNNGLTTSDLLSLEGFDQYLFAGTIGSGIFRSPHSAANWYQVNNGLTDYTIKTFESNLNYLFAGSHGGGVFRSSNNGMNWSPVNTGLTFQQIHDFARYLDGSDASVSWIFVATWGGGIFRSSNNGDSWTAVNNGLNVLHVYSLESKTTNIFAGVNGGGVYLSKDLGENWQAKNEGFSVPPTVLSMCITNDYIFAGTLGQGFWKRPLAEIIGINKISTEVPEKFSLSQNYPNPFNPTTKIRLDIPSLVRRGAGVVVLKVYDVLGKEMQTLINEQLSPGTYEAEFDGTNYPSGVYYYQLNAGDYSETKKMVLLK